MSNNWWDAAPTVSAFDDALAAEGASGVLADIARSIYQQESGSGRNTATSNAGAVGGMQILPGTFREVADDGWDISDPLHNARAGIRYIKRLSERVDGDPLLTAVGYYGGPGAQQKARDGVAVSDPRNPKAPNTLQYAQQVVARIGAGVAQDGAGDWWASLPLADAVTAPVAAKAEPHDISPEAAKLRKADALEKKAAGMSRSIGEMAADTGIAALQGAMGVAALPALAYEMLGGSKDNLLRRTLNQGMEAGDALKSDAMRAEQEAVSARMATADNWREALALGIQAGLNPTIAADMAARMFPQMLASGGAAALAGKAAAGVAGLAKAAPVAAAIAGRGAGVAEAAASVVGKVATSPLTKLLPSATTAGAVGTSALIQGDSVGNDLYQELMKAPPDAWERGVDAFVPLRDALLEQAPQGLGNTAKLDWANTQARQQLADDMSRSATGKAALISLAANALPGGSSIERMFAKGAAPAAVRQGMAGAAIKGVVGEGLVSEPLEEGGGEWVKSVALQALDPSIDPMKSAAGAAGQAMGVASPMGAVGGMRGAMDSNAQLSMRERIAAERERLQAMRVVKDRAGEFVAEKRQQAVADIGAQTSVDGAIAAANRAVNIDSDKLLAEALGSVGIDLAEIKAADAAEAAQVQAVQAQAEAAQKAAEQAAAMDSQAAPLAPIAAPAVNQNTQPGIQSEPARVWYGRRGDGYVTTEDAERGLKERTRIQSGLDWKVEQTPDGKYRLAGYAPVAAQAAAPAPAMAVTPTPVPESMPMAPTATPQRPDGMTGYAPAAPAPPPAPEQAALVPQALAQAAPAAAERHPTWRKNAIQAERVARALGLEPKGKRLAQIVAEIDARDAQQTGAAQDGADLSSGPIDQEWSAFAPETGTLGIARAQMPQIKAEHRGALVNFLKARGIDSAAGEVPANDLKPTQAEFAPGKVKKAREFQGSERSILVSSDGHVVDGHHQWLAKRAAGEPVKVIRLKAPIRDVLAQVAEFPSTRTSEGAARAMPAQAATENVAVKLAKDEIPGESSALAAKQRWEQAKADDVQQAERDRMESDKYNAYVREQEFQAERRRLQGDRTIQQASGKPFKTEASAKAKLDEFDLGDTHAIGQVDGGFVLRDKREGRESYTQAQAAVLADMGIGENADGEIDATEPQWAEIERRIAERLGRKPAEDATQQPAPIAPANVQEGIAQARAKRKPKTPEALASQAQAATDSGADAQGAGAMFSRAGNAGTEAERQFKETERAYGGRAAYDRAKAAGKTRLTYGQWVQVRTPKFKAWFGDWEAQASNDLVNQQIDQWANGELSANVVLNIGRPSFVLTQHGVPNLPITLRQAILRKAVKDKHGVAAAELKDIAQAVQAPIAIFDDPDNTGTRIAVTEIRHTDGNIIAAIRLNMDRDGLEINDIRSLHPKRDSSVLRWVEDGLLLGLDKKKGRDWLENLAATNPQQPQASFAALDEILYDADSVRNASKAVDPDTGEPLVVYHGTGADFSVFNRAAESIFGYGDNPDAGGIFFDADPKVLEYYAEPTRRGTNYIPAYLRIENPAILRANMALDRQAQALRKAQDDAHDGAILGGLEYVVFSPEQIKSAIGNNGEFDGTNSDIRFSRAQQPMSPDLARAILALGSPPKQATKESVRAAVRELVNGLGLLPNRLGRIVVATSAEIKQDWEPLIGPTGMEASGDAGRAQGFYDPKSKTVFLIADNILQGDELGVVAHELMHKHGPAVLGEEGWNRLHGALGGWAKAKVGSMERIVYDEAVRRVQASGPELSTQELFPYAVQVALEMGVRPNAVAPQGTVERWLSQVRAALRTVWEKITRKPELFKSQDLVNLAFGIAQRESPEHAGELDGAIGAAKDNLLNPGNPMFSRASRPSQNQATGFSLPEETLWLKKRRQFQDYFLRVKVAQDAVLKQGGVLDEKTDTYLAEELSHGRTASLLEDFAKNQVEPLMKKALQLGIEQDELSLFAYAMHAPERNAQIASIDAQLQDGGSGMTNAEAKAIIDQARQDGKLADLQDLHSDLMGITTANRLVMLDEGLITQTEFDAINGAYQNYIPLRGFEVVDEDGKRTGLSAGKGFNVRGKETMRAKGRTSRAGLLIENAIADYQRTVVRAERNHVAKVFLNFAMKNPDPALWEIDALTTRKAIDRQTGRIARSTEVDKGEDTIAVKVNGVEIFIRIKDELLLRAMKRAHTDDTGETERVLMRSVGLYTSLLRNTLTRFNPEFAVVNALRDFGFGAVAALDDLGAKGAAKFVAHYAGAIAASARNERNRLSPQSSDWDKWFTEYRAAGGTTSGFYAKGAEEVAKDIRQILLTAGAQPKDWKERLVANRPARAVKAVGRVLEFAGATSENAARVAAYRTAREMGKTPSQAASIAKNLTTNFDRKGELGQLTNSFYVFFNAAVQGSQRTLKMLGNKKVLGYMAGVTAASVGLALFSAIQGGDDPDDDMAYWDKIPAHVKERNIILMLPPGEQIEGAQEVGSKGRYIAIPVQYGLNVFHVLGYQIADVMRHQKDKTRGSSFAKAGIAVASAVAGSFNPLGGAVDLSNGSSVAQAIAPSLMDPVIQLATGTNAFGRDVAPFKSPFDTKPDSDNANVRQEGGTYHRVAQWINAATGGDEYESGAIDLSPGTLENVVRAMTGGTGPFLYDVLNLSAKTVERAMGGDPDLFVRDVPFWRKVYGETAGDVDQGLFYERRKEIEEARGIQKRREEAGLEMTDIKKLYQASMASDASKFTRALSDLRKDMVAVKKDAEMSDVEKRTRLRELRAERDAITSSFNKEWMEVMKEWATDQQSN